MDLYFGCRQEDCDNLYADERRTMLDAEVLRNNFTALSREPGVPKVGGF